MDKKTIPILIVAAIVTMILVGLEVYFWKSNSSSLLDRFLMIINFKK